VSTQQPNGQSEAAKKPAMRLVVDPEIQTMAQIDQLLAALESDAARQRVVNWVVDKFDRPQAPALKVTE
jgi:predicted 3-demethylubiquinone-9 3-methyltransferase (glyoxalase superfamily)